MVERLKLAVAKARQKRAQIVPARVPEQIHVGDGPPPVDPVARTNGLWESLEQVSLDPAHLERKRVIAYTKKDSAHVAFDVLRTRLLRVFGKNEWVRLGVTSPAKGCGKTFVATNLAMSLSRQADSRTVLVDLDLRSPTVSDVLGVEQTEPIRWFLSGDVPAETFLRRVGSNLALALNGTKIADAAETLLSARTAETLASLQAQLSPNVMIYDLPPMLACDDVLGLLPQLDCVLLVVGAGTVRPQEVKECERLLADQTPLLGVLLNRAEDANMTRYGEYDRT